MRKIYLSILFALLAGSAQAQKLKAVTPVVDMGQVQFYTPTSGLFEVKNTSNKPIKITKVDTGCGCVVASYPTDAIAAGAKFTMRIAYDARQMGHFDKVIEVFSNDSPQPLTLELRGVVVEEVADFIGDFPFALGSLKADCNTIVFDDVHQGERFQQRFHIYNPTGKTVQPQIMHLPAYLKADVSPSKLAPNRSAEVTITLDSRFIRDFGLEQTQIFLGANPGEKVSSSKQIDVSVVLLPALIELTEAQKKLAPCINLSTTKVSLPMADGKKRSVTIDIQNTGRTPLDIQNMQLLASGVKVELSKKTLSAGETAKLKITSEPKKYKNSNESPRIIMITNDPEQQKVVINIDKN